MKGGETKLIKFMEGADKRFIIPVYQRNYDWKIENCKQLYNDLVRVINNNRRSHFFGSIVSAYNPDGDNEEFLIIDGQQRLTTVSLILLAMHNLIKTGIVIPQDKNLETRLFEDYLVDKYQPEQTRIKLKPVKNDKLAFEKLFEDEEDHLLSSNLTTNYDYFYNRIQLQEITIEELFKAIRSLEVINIKLDTDDNPQLIFESLNSTGVDLNEGDKIRNYILMGQPTKIQEVWYEKYWNRIEEATNYQVDSFVRDYLSLKQQTIPSMKKIYTSFKEYVEISAQNNEELLSDLLDYAKVYHILLTGDVSNKVVSSCIARLNRMETTVTRPFFLEVLMLYKKGELSEAKIEEIFHFTENYLFRRMMCDLPTNALNKIFCTLHKDVMRNAKEYTNYADAFKYVLITKKDRSRFPKDEEFANGITTKDIYSMNSKNKIYIFERLENQGTIEDKDIYRHIESGDYSIEHIMPQTLSEKWMDSLGEDCEVIHDKWIHRLANLTLTGYNSKYSNNTFIEKRDMEKGFKESGLRMNQWIARRDKWDLDELEERNNYLQNLSLDIWEYPSTNFIPEIQESETYTLNDDIDFTGRKPVGFSYKNIVQSVKSWKELLERILILLHSEDKTIMYNLVLNRDRSNYSAYFTSEPDYDREITFVRIDHKLYVDTNTGTSQKIYLLRKLFDLYQLDYDELSIILSGLSEYDSRVLENDTKRLRMEYWDYSLPIIKSINNNNDMFDNADPWVENWIPGKLSMNRVTIVCVVNKTVARVVLNIDKYDREENEHIYNLLYSHKEDIEKSLDMPLIWDNNPELRKTKVYVQLTDVKLYDKKTWEQIANFHAKLSAGFYNKLIVPYLSDDK